MAPRTPIAASLVAALALCASGCAGRALATRVAPGVLPRSQVDAASEAERAALQRLDTSPDGTTFEVGTERLSLGAPYFAASGLQCRRVQVEQGARSRALLACRHADGWHYVPEVFTAPAPVSGAQEQSLAEAKP